MQDAAQARTRSVHQLKHTRSALPALSGAALFFALALSAQAPPPAQTAPASAPIVQSTAAGQAPDTAQTPQMPPGAPIEARPIAIVALDSTIPGYAAVVTGALQVFNGRAFIAANGAITAGSQTAQVTLPYRGTLQVCASTTVKLSTDSSVPAGEVPGLMMAMDHGAIEASFATGRNSDVLLTPDFRILIGGPGAAEVKVRLGQGGDTCVDNAGVNAPYVLVSSVFEEGAYRVQPGQRVMFQHGNLHEVVDQEKEPCGCPPPPKPESNDFPLAQSEGLAPLSAPAPSPDAKVGHAAQTTETLAYSATEHAPQPAEPAQPAAALATPPAPAVPAPKRSNFFVKVGHFFRRLFGGD